MTTEIGLSVPEGSLGFWLEHRARHGVAHDKPSVKFREPTLAFRDPDGLRLELIVPSAKDDRLPWQTAAVRPEAANRGFHNVTLTLGTIKISRPQPGSGEIGTSRKFN